MPRPSPLAALSLTALSLAALFTLACDAQSEAVDATPSPDPASLDASLPDAADDEANPDDGRPEPLDATPDDGRPARFDATPEPDADPVDLGDPPDLDPNAGPRFDCAADLDPFTDRSDHETCRAVDIFDPTTCTPANRGFVCGQLARCDPGFWDPGQIVRCCDGARWVYVFEEPDPCGLPPPED